jgi:hypothetical protein
MEVHQISTTHPSEPRPYYGKSYYFVTENGAVYLVATEGNLMAVPAMERYDALPADVPENGRKSKWDPWTDCHAVKQYDDPLTEHRLDSGEPLSELQIEHILHQAFKFRFGARGELADIMDPQ